MFFFYFLLPLLFFVVVVICYCCAINFVKMSGKGKNKYVSIKDKLKALKIIDQGEALRKIASDYGVGATTEGDWHRYRNKIEQCSSVESVIGIQRKINEKKSDYEMSSEALFFL